MDKSAINLLQELSMKQGYIPTYNFMEKRVDGSGSMQFTCNVCCKQLNARGIGSSKKEAKHDAAKNMLLLLNINNKIPMPIDTLPSSVANMVQQSPAKVYETSPSCEQSTNRNYIGLLQEFCQQQKIPTTDILYKVYDEGLTHLKTFTIEVSVGSLRERATASCKKMAKQEAARKLLLHLNPKIADSNMVNKNVLNINKIDKETLENNIRKLGTRISDCVINKESTLSELSEKAKSLYHECKRYEKINQKTDPFVMKDVHALFERNYSSKIPYSMRERMQILRDKYTLQTDFTQMRQDIECSLNVKIKQFTVHSISENHIICLRLLCKPCITQFGMGETRFIAESRAMYNLIATILMFLNA